MTGPLIIGFEDKPQGRDAVILGRTLAKLADAEPLLRRSSPGRRAR